MTKRFHTDRLCKFLYCFKILNSFNFGLQLKDTAVRNKLIDLLSELKI